MEGGQKAGRDRESGQVGLFGIPAPEEDEQLPTVDSWTDRDQLRYEKEMLGFYVTGHPLNAYAEKIRELSTHSSENLDGLAQGTEVAICGVITTIQLKRNREAKLWAAVQLEDLSGTVDLLIFAASYESLRPMLVPDEPVLIRGTVRPDENGPPKVAVSDITPLDKARVRLPRQVFVKVRLNNGDVTPRLADLFRRKPGETDVCFRLERRGDFLVLLDSGLRVRADREFCAAAEEILGPGAVEIVPT
jgi:DNA polymerase III subunit alpha